MNRAGSAPGLWSRLPHSARTSSTKPAVTHSVSTPSRTSSDNPVHGCIPRIMHPRLPTHETIVCSPQATALAERREMDVEARAPGQPCPDLGSVVGGVVVAHQVHVKVSGHGLVDRGQELAELDCPVAAVQFADDR